MTFKMSNTLYDILKKVVTIILPAVMTLTATVLPALGVAEGDTTSVVTIIGAVTTFLGAVLGISTAAYNKESEEAVG